MLWKQGPRVSSILGLAELCAAAHVPGIDGRFSRSTDRARLARGRWLASETVDNYRSFIQTSRGEFSVAKHGYVVSRCGWLSDRTVCYLASGRPAIVQDTGLRDWLPVGEGIFAFRSPAEAAAEIEAMNVDYAKQRCAARRLAEEYFDS